MAPFRDPNAAFLVVLAGGLLVYWELMRPGTVIPGAAGASLVMLGVASFASAPVPWQAVALSGAAVLLAVADARFGLRGCLGLAAGVLLAFGARWVGVRWPVALAGVPFLVATSVLLNIAWRAREAKQI